MFRKKVLLFLLSAITTSATAQSQASDYTVTIPTQFSPTLSDAQQKINENAIIVDTTTIKTAIAYNVFSPVYAAQFTPEPITAPKIGRDQITRLYRNFIKFGLGNYWTPYLDFEINNLRSTQYAFGVRGFHHSTWGKIKGYAPAQHSDSRVGVFGQKFFKDYTLYASADYNHLMATCYGFQLDSVLLRMPEFKVNAKNIRRQYHHANAHVDFSRNSPKDAHVFNQLYSIDYNFITGITNEHQLAFKTDLNKDIKVAKVTYLNLGGEIGVNYYNNPVSIIFIQAPDKPLLQDNITLNFKPSASLNYKEYFLKAGLNFFVHFPVGYKAKVHFYPDIQARLHIVPNIFTVYAGIDGGLRRNSYLSYVQENPYITPEWWSPIGFMNEKMRIFGGMKVGLSRSLSIGAKASYAVCDDMPFFINHEWIFSGSSDKYYTANTFDVVLDNVKCLNLHFDLSYTYKQQLYLTLNADYNNYSITENLLRPWYKPAFVGNLDMRYILLNKFVFNFATFLHTGIYYPKFIDGNMGYEKLRLPVCDFNFGFEYLWSKRLAFFANVNNFACQRNYYYYDYPTQRINCLVGVKYNFGGEKVGKKQQ